MLETREIFRGFPLWMQITFYVVSMGAMAIFFYGFYRRVIKYRKGKDAHRFNDLVGRFLKASALMAKNTTIWKRDVLAGLAHTLVFWGFVILFIGTVLVFLDHDILRFVGIHLLSGKFYLFFSATLDIAGVLFLLGLVMMMVRRGFVKPPQLDYTRPDMKKEEYNRSAYKFDDQMFLWLLFIIGFSGFLIEGFRIAVDRPAFEIWSPVGWGFANMTDLLGLTASANSLHAYTWWFHALIVMVFIAYIPYSKAMHILVDFANLMFKDELTAKRLPKVPEEQVAEGMGYQSILDFNWKELMDFDACTKCGRCHQACPANASGAPLSPRDLILDLRTHADATLGVSEWWPQTFTATKADNASLVGDVIKPETLWACTSCMACVEACPVGIEHLTSIVQMRRGLVEEGEMDDSLQDALTNISEYGNSFGQSDRMRAKWTKGLDFKIKDVRKEAADFLWFVGDYASYDQRLQDLSRTVAKVFRSLGLDYGILYDGEKNSGNDVRRIGEEGLYEMLVEDNLEAFSNAQFKEIFTTDPHSFNTIKNEYPEFGGDYSIYHYSGLLAKMIAEGKLAFSQQLTKKVTFHDPCYLGRYNGETEAPRKILEALGVDFQEMPRCKSNSFCCGAGGGRIWMDDSNLAERPSEMRIKEALSLGDIDYFVVCCPKDYVMYSDAVKTSGNEGKIEVKDIIELVQEAMG